jgi:hypothetical protein
VPKASPAKFNFNAGEFAITVEGRTDLDRYPSSMRRLDNCIAAPQGPCIRRSGTYYTGNAYKHDKLSGLVSFVFSDEQAQVLEFCDLRLRFMTEDGFQVYTPVTLSAVVTASPFKFTAAGLGAAVGDELIITGFAENLNVDGRVTKITAKSGNDYTVDIPYTGTTGAKVGVTVARLYHITTVYSQADVRNIVAVQDVDIIYLFCKNYRTKTLSRYGAYDWRLADMEFIDGPFEPEDVDVPILTPSETGRATGDHTSDTAGSPDMGTCISGGYYAAGTESFRAFDFNRNTYWQSNTNQFGWVGFQFSVPTVIEGYTIYQIKTTGGPYTPTDYSPATFTFEASNNGIAWTVLDEKFSYPSYKNLRSQYIKINNIIAYTHYRLKVDSVGLAGNLPPCVAELVLRKKGSLTITLTATSTDKINRGEGFKSTDVGRLIRVSE